MEDENTKNINTTKTFLLAFLLLALAVAIGYGTGARTAKNHYEPMIASCEENLILAEAAQVQEPELVYMVPLGCTDLCKNLTGPVIEVADEAGLGFKQIELLSGLNVPGIYILNGTRMSVIWPFDTAENLNRIMCNEFKMSRFC